MDFVKHQETVAAHELITKALLLLNVFQLTLDTLENLPQAKRNRLRKRQTVWQAVLKHLPPSDRFHGADF